ncbi:MAG TPA: class I SAM-dependent methyltransferase [Gaiellaceae bacterium]|nr:class I SAM-dependent methyltransferase [Gaiellaceae bacterium]
MRPVIDFVLAELPPVTARVLEVGCGDGELARTLERAGYDVVAIDPAAPDGPIFRPIKLEEVDDHERFDAVVAVRSLHHVTDVGSALGKIASLLVPRGRLVVDELAWDRLDARTAEWFHGRRRALATAGRTPPPPATVEACRREWEEEHVGLHGYAALREALDERFREVAFAWTAVLHRYLDGVAAQSLERALIEADAIQALGFRYVGVR